MPCRFYQHIVNGCEWDFGIVWGHSVSSDLVHWEHMPPALIPSEGVLLAGTLLWAGCMPPPQLHDRCVTTACNGTACSWPQHAAGTSETCWQAAGNQQGHLPFRLLQPKPVPTTLHASCAGGHDADGCFSGCGVVDTNGVPTILYTGGRLASLHFEQASSCLAACLHIKMQCGLGSRCCRCLCTLLSCLQPEALHCCSQEAHASMHHGGAGSGWQPVSVQACGCGATPVVGPCHRPNATSTCLSLRASS